MSLKLNGGRVLRSSEQSPNTKSINLNESGFITKIDMGEVWLLDNLEESHWISQAAYNEFSGRMMPPYSPPQIYLNDLETPLEVNSLWSAVFDKHYKKFIRACVNKYYSISCVAYRNVKKNVLGVQCMVPEDVSMHTGQIYVEQAVDFRTKPRLWFKVDESASPKKLNTHTMKLSIASRMKKIR